ncbi:hypothetical protein ABGB18_03790 [Nonomuraea sp. B12E4]|uniref:hypothetical protein n=1 Tax=Nonomuraea sp. B12E4 TaxID=3153564 RepID=UPI00325E7075
MDMRAERTNSGRPDPGGLTGPELGGGELLEQLAHLREAGPHNLARVVAEAAPRDDDAEFEQGLAALLDGHGRSLRHAGEARR